MKTSCLKLLVTVNAFISLVLLANTAPERVVSVRQVPESGATLVKLENNVLMNFKRADFEKGRVSVTASFGGGMLGLPPELPGLNMLAQGTFILGGLEDRSIADIRQQLRKSVGEGSLGFSLSLHRNNLSGNCPSERLAEFLEFFIGYFTAPGFRPESKDMAVNRHVFSTVSASASANVMPNIIMGELANDARFTMPSYEDISARTIAEVRQWLAPQLETSGIEISIAGDISYDDALTATLKTFGALPTRHECAAFKADDSIKFVKKPGSTIIKTLDVSSKQAAFACVWHVSAKEKNAHRMSAWIVLAEVIRNNVAASLREQSGITGVVGAMPFMEDTLPNVGCFVVSAAVDPVALGKAIDIARQCLARLAREGASEKDIARVKDSLVEIARYPSRTNDSWTSELDNAQTDPKKLKVNLGWNKDYENITREEVNALAASLLNFDQAYLIKAVPGK